MNVLLTSIGRRVQIVNFFKKVLGGKGYVYSTDVDRTAPGLYCSDKGIVVPPVANENEYISKIIEICNKENINLIIPFIDPELPLLARNKEIISYNTNAIVLVSSFEVVNICNDKLLTAKFFTKNDIPTPFTWEKSNFVWQNFPVIVKPRFGSAGKGVYECDSGSKLKLFLQEEDVIIQQKLNGFEVTLDVLCDLNSNCLAIVPRKRLKIRAGEVERGITIKSDELLQWGQKIVSLLKPIGPINIQCFIVNNEPFFTEINPRFGGGYPLTYFAGVNFPKMIIDFVKGEIVEPCIGKYEHNLLMLRYDDAIIKKEEELIG